MAERSKLVKMRISNYGCIGLDGLIVDLDRIVCLVGPNNTGKTTILKAYEAAVNQSALTADDFNLEQKDKPSIVELWVHIPAGAGNVDEKWKVAQDGLLLVRSKWEWPAGGGKPVRRTWDPQVNDYAEDDRASGLDNVFNSRLPKPFRIGVSADTEEEHGKLISLVIEPVLERYTALMKDENSEIRSMLAALQMAAEKPVDEFRGIIQEVEGKVNTSYRNIFSASEIKLTVGLGKINFNPSDYLKAGSRVDVSEKHGQTKWSQQGDGSQRALFWSMLQVRSELDRILELKKGRQKGLADAEKNLKTLQSKTLKQAAAIEKNKADIKAAEFRLQTARAALDKGDDKGEELFLPGHMLLIDEPETALHPGAIRAAREHLYALANDVGWQVMLTTHCPAFIDPLKDHTTIVRLHRPEANASPNVYRSDDAKFTGDEKENLKSLLAFNDEVAEIFFGAKPILVEGDTECAAFTEILNSSEGEFPFDKRPIVVRARGKYTIPLLIEILNHFKIDFSVLHDIDSPKTSGGAKNSAYAANEAIAQKVKQARESGRKVVYMCSCPNFEKHFKLELPRKDKPFQAWKAVKEDLKVREEVKAVLMALALAADNKGTVTDGITSEVQIKLWVKNNKLVAETAYDFS
jgi:predicted ATP-dependent endonuclease of OLD family